MAREGGPLPSVAWRHPLAVNARASGEAVESIDFGECPVNRVALSQPGDKGEKRRIYGYSGHTAQQLLITTVSGVLIGICGVSLQTGIEYLVWLRNLLLQPLYDAGLLPALAAQLAVSIVVVLLTSTCVHYFAPKAAGAGVAAVMALQNGCAIPNLLTVRVLVVKYIGTMASRVACLALGPEGPMVHLGACLASLVYTSEHSLRRRLAGLRQRKQQHLELDGRNGSYVTLPCEPTEAGPAPCTTQRKWLFNAVDHREVCMAGSAAGLAAAFGAPIGGVLFSLEEASTHWSRKTIWRCFLCAIAATFTLSQLHPRAASGMLQLRGLYSLTNIQWLFQMGFIILASAGGGLLGAVFNLLRIRLRKARSRQQGAAAVLWGSAAVALLTVLCMALLPKYFGRCLEVPQEWGTDNVVRQQCPEGQYNDLGTALLGDAVWVIKSLLSLGSDAEPINKHGNVICSLSIPCYYSARTLAIFCVTYLLLMVAASSINVPGGLFMPAIMTGASFGALFGLALLTYLPASWDIQPGLYALVGATATLGGVFRGSISLVVVVVEGTRGIDFLFGIILAVVVSNYVAHCLHPHGVYESELEEQNGTVFFLRQEPPHALRNRTAGSVMAAPAVGFPSIVPAHLVAQVLRSTTHNGFVVYCRGSQLDGVTGAGQLEGLISRDQLLVLLRQRAYCDEQGRYLRPPCGGEAAYEAALDAEMQLVQARSSAVCSDRGGGAVGGENGGSSDGGGGGLSGIREEQGGLEGGPGGASPSSGGSPPVGAFGYGLGSRPAGAWGSPTSCLLGEAEHLNLEPFVNLAPLTVRPETPCPRVWQLFLSLSLRHLVVVDARGLALGMLTRKDLDHAAGDGWWRVNPMAPTPVASNPTWITALSQQALRSLAVPVSASRRLISALSHKFSVSPHGSGVLQRAEGDSPHGAAPSPHSGVLRHGDDEDHQSAGASDASVSGYSPPPPLGRLHSQPPA